MYELLPERIEELNLDCALVTLGKRTVILCIVYDRVSGACLGQLVGLMIDIRNENDYVYCTILH